MPLQNDTRGWIMTALSGVGELNAIVGYVHKLTGNSMRVWSFIHLHRYYRSSVSRQERLQNTRQRHLPIAVVEP